MGTTPTSGAVLQEYLRRQHRRLERGVGELAADSEPDARADTSAREHTIHRTRVAARRLRSALRVFAGFVDADEAAQLDAELSWLAGLLGAVRDPQVLRRRLTPAVQALDVTLRLGPVQAALDGELYAREAAAELELAAALGGRRCVALLRATARWATSPPLTERAQRDAEALVRRASRVAAVPGRRLAAAAEVSGRERAEFVHRARKAAKRARYAAELVRDVPGVRHGKRAARRLRHWQDVLGEHQDAVLAAELLLQLGRVHGVRAGENGFAFGLLYQQQTQRAETALAGASDLAR